MDSTEPRPPPRILSPPYAGPCRPGARRISRASGDRLTLHTALLHGVSHQVTQTLYANPAEEQGATRMVVASAGTMSHFTDYLNRDLSHFRNFSWLSRELCLGDSARGRAGRSPRIFVLRVMA